MKHSMSITFCLGHEVGGHHWQTSSCFVQPATSKKETVKNNHRNLRTYQNLSFRYDPGDRPHILEAADLTMSWYKAGRDAIGHNLPPRSGKSSLIHVLAVELKEAGAPYVHVLTPWANLADQLADEPRLLANCRRLVFDGWSGKFLAHPVSAIESSRYWHRKSHLGMGPLDPWTMITSTIHLVHCNKAMVRDAVALAVEINEGARPVFVFDETHLLAETKEWASTLLDLQSAGAFVVTMTGTASRADGACILGFRNDPRGDWDEAKETVVIRRGEPYVRDSDGTLVRDVTKQMRWGQERLIETVATGLTVDWQHAFDKRWLHPVSAEPVDFKVAVNGEVERLSELDAKTAERGRSEWLKSSECCRALAQKAVQELWSWRSNSSTMRTKMLVITTQDRDFAGGSAEKAANAHAREMRRQILDAIQSSPMSDKELVVEICTSVTNDGEPDDSAAMKLKRFGLVAPDCNGNTPIDILIVKTMGIVGLDVPECKVQIDASSIRRGPMKKQLATRPLTQWTLADGSALMREAVIVYPCDPANQAFYKGLTETSNEAKEKQWDDSALENETIEIKPSEPLPELINDSGHAAGYANEGGRWLEGDYDELIARIRAKYPAACVIRKIDVIEAWKQGAFPNCEQAEADGTTRADEWSNRVVNTSDRMQQTKEREQFGKKAKRLASKVYNYADKEQSEKWKKLVAVLQLRAKERCHISRDLPVDKIQDFAVIERLKAALDEVFHAAVSEVVAT
jgi:hypothetical protein